MSNIPKTRVRRTLGRDIFTAFFESAIAAAVIVMILTVGGC